MSIVPSLNRGSTSTTSSSLAPSHSSTSNHGFLSPNPLPQSQQFSDTSPPLNHLSGQVAHAAYNRGGFAKEVKRRERKDHGKSPIQPHDGKTLPQEDVASSQFGYSGWRGKPSGAFVYTGNHGSAAPTTSQTSSGHSTGKKTQIVNGNHLLNFHYDPISISRAQSWAPPPRRQQKRKPYNKDLFFQANYKFVVLDTGNYAAEFIDPDKMLCWEDIICLKYATPCPVQCPICLDNPLCPQITSCGHIFCFPCILQYFSLDEDDLKGECWKKCPLCFTMISSKDLYTIYINNVKEYHVGNEIEFILLSREKDSFSSSVKNNASSCIEIQDSFSKFTLTSDVELSVREAMSDLDSWIARADSGLVDDIEKLPFVCAAMEHLERRKKYWNEHRDATADKTYSVSPPTATIAPAKNNKLGQLENSSPNKLVDEFCALEINKSNCGSPPIATISANKNINPGPFENSSSNKLVDEFCAPEVTEFKESLEDHDQSSSSLLDDSNKYLLTHSDESKDRKDGDSYNFYQAVDGQHLILHPFSMKCLLHHYGSYEKLPDRLSGKILQLETVTQSEAMRRRYRFLSHFSLTTTFQLCEINVVDILPSGSLSPFMEEIKNREKQRKRLARKELKDKIKAEVEGSQFVPVPYYSYDTPPNFSMDDFEALGSPAVTSSGSSTTIGERLSFSSVARLGFAAAHDSPALKTEEIQTAPKSDSSHDSSSATGRKNNGSSFANVTSRAKHVEVVPDMGTRVNEGGKKGKKQSRVLLSTAGGRRY